jgi:hypothetical protein
VTVAELGAKPYRNLTITKKEKKAEERRRETEKRGNGRTVRTDMYPLGNIIIIIIIRIYIKIKQRKRLMEA